MSIETYADIMMKFYMGLFLLSVFAGVAAIWSKIRKKTLRYWWLIPCTMLYSIVAVFNVFFASIAYDDPADPNYRIYKNWELKDFILNDIKVLIIWLFIVVVLYLVLRRKEYKMPAKTGRLAALIFLAVLLTGAVIWILFTVTISPKREKEYITIYVEGFDVTYPTRGEKITMEAVSDIELGSSGIEIGDKLGEPDAFIGSGMLRPVYFVEGNQVVVFHFTYPAALEDLRQIVLVGENGESRIIKEKESGNAETPAEMQNAIYVSGMLASYRYIDRELSTEYFYNLDHTSTYGQIVQEIGEPNGHFGSGLSYEYYEVGEGLYVTISFSYDENGGYDEVGLIRLCTQEEIVDIIYPNLQAYTEQLLEMEWNDCMESAAGNVEESEYNEEVAQIKLEVKQGYEEEVINILQNRFMISTQAPPLPKSEFTKEIENGDVRYVFSTFMEGKRAKTREVAAYVVYDEKGKMYVYIMG